MSILEKADGFEIVRSYSRKKNLGGYETEDWFASYKAVVPKGVTDEELKEISSILSEKAENDVEDKIDPSRSITRRQTNTELKSKISDLQKTVDELTKRLNKLDQAF